MHHDSDYYDYYKTYDYYYESDYESDYDQIVMDSFYPCIKYKNLADLKRDGTDYFIVAESTTYRRYAGYEFINYQIFDKKIINCSLSFTCENDQTAFYKLIKDCLRFRIPEENFCDFRKQYWFSLILCQIVHYK